MAKREAIYKKVRLEFTQDNFYIVIANSLAEGFELVKGVDKNLKKYSFPDKFKDCEALCMPMPYDGVVAVFFQYHNLMARFICHEVSHATNAMLLYIGVPLSDDTDEVYAYHNDMLFRMVVEFCKENKLRVKL